MSRYLAGGGDNFSILLLGRERRTGMMDVDAFAQYLGKHPALTAGPLNRFERLD